jgi:hypothetical protein
MKFTVAVSETIYRSTTYLIKAKSKEEAQSKVAQQRWNEMKLIESDDYDGRIDEIHSVEPFIK